MKNIFSHQLSAKKAKSLLSFVTLIIFVFLLIMDTTPARAGATVCVTPDADATIAAQTGTIVANFAVTVVHYAAQVYQWVIENADRALQLAASVVPSQINALLQGRLAQAGNDSRTQESNRGFYVNSNLPYAMMVPRRSIAQGGTPGVDTGNTSCVVNHMTQQFGNIGLAISELTRAIEAYAPLPVGAGTATAAAALVHDMCQRGLIDPATRGRRADGIGCPSTAPYSGRFADSIRRPMTVFGPDFYAMPQGASTTTTNPKRLILPDNNVAESDMGFIAAMFTCRVFQPQVPTPTTPAPTANGTTVNTELQILTEIRTQARSTGSTYDCARGVAERTRISKALAQQASGNSLLNGIYLAQVSMCRSLLNLGSITNDQYTECQDKGMSYIEIQKWQNCPGAGSGVVQAGSGATAIETSRIARETSLSCSQYQRDLERQRAYAIAQMMQTAPAQGLGPGSPAPDPNAR